MPATLGLTPLCAQSSNYPTFRQGHLNPLPIFSNCEKLSLWPGRRLSVPGVWKAKPAPRLLWGVEVPQVSQATAALHIGAGVQRWAPAGARRWHSIGPRIVFIGTSSPAARPVGYRAKVVLGWQARRPWALGVGRSTTLTTRDRRRWMRSHSSGFAGRLSNKLSVQDTRATRARRCLPSSSCNMAGGDSRQRQARCCSAARLAATK